MESPLAIFSSPRSSFLYINPFLFLLSPFFPLFDLWAATVWDVLSELYEYWWQGSVDFSWTNNFYTLPGNACFSQWSMAPHCGIKFSNLYPAIQRTLFYIFIAWTLSPKMASMAKANLSRSQSHWIKWGLLLNKHALNCITYSCTEPY